MGEKASCGQQDSRNATTQTMVGGTLSAKQHEMEAAHNLENARAFTYSFVYFSLGELTRACQSSHSGSFLLRG